MFSDAISSIWSCWRASSPPTRPRTRIGLGEAPREHLQWRDLGGNSGTVVARQVARRSFKKSCTCGRRGCRLQIRWQDRVPRACVLPVAFVEVPSRSSPHDPPRPRRRPPPSGDQQPLEPCHLAHTISGGSRATRPPKPGTPSLGLRIRNQKGPGMSRALGSGYLPTLVGAHCAPLPEVDAHRRNPRCRPWHRRPAVRLPNLTEPVRTAFATAAASVDLALFAASAHTLTAA